MNYDRILTVARSMIQKNGRSLAFYRLDDTAADTSKPWSGSSDPRGSGATEVSPIYGVFVDPAAAANLGIVRKDDDLLKRASQVAIVEPPADGTDLSGFHEVLDEGTRWRVVEAQKLRPGSTTLLFFVWVTR